MKSHHIEPTLYLLFIFSFSAHALEKQSLFSPFNKYELSYSSYITTRNAIEDSSIIPWLSIPGCFVQENPAFLFTAEDQSIGANIDGLLGYEFNSDQNQFGAFMADIAYNSKYLQAYISPSVYTTDNNINSQFRDIGFERFIKEKEKAPISGAFDFRFNLPQAYLQTNFKSISLSTGKEKMRWGPGYKGTLGLSGTAYSPFYFYNLTVRFGNLLRMESFLCNYDDESIYNKELSFSEKIKVKNNGVDLQTAIPRYGAGQRLDLRLGKHLQIGIYELSDFFGSSDLARFANPLQIYFLSNEESGTNNANLLGGIDFNLIIDRFRIYGEFINDDITVFENTGNPNKYAYQIGTTLYGKGSLIETGVEYTHIAPYVYGHSRVLNRHSLWGESLGWPWGNDQDLFNAHALIKLPFNINGKFEINYLIKGKGTIESDWYADGKPNLDHAPYWPQHAEKIVSGMVGAEYKPVSWSAFTIYYEPIWEGNKFRNGFYSYLNISIPGCHEFKVK